MFEQMGNVYREVGRNLDVKRHHDTERYKQALIQALDLIDATTQGLDRHHSHRAREVLRSKEEFSNACYGDASAVETESLGRYFIQFAVVARLRQ
jgi:hypothetical protein